MPNRDVKFTEQAVFPEAQDSMRTREGIVNLYRNSGASGTTVASVDSNIINGVPAYHLLGTIENNLREVTKKTDANGTVYVKYIRLLL